MLIAGPKGISDDLRNMRAKLITSAVYKYISNVMAKLKRKV